MELITRVKALLRRTETEDIKVLQVENITLDHERHMVFVDDKPVELTFKEYELTLRQKLGEAGSKIRTVRNVGYVIE